MPRRTIRCSCGADFPIPEVPPSVLHCPRCGEAMHFNRDGGTADRVREDIREPIKPLPPRNPYYPLILLSAAGLVIAGGLVGLIVAFSGREADRVPEVLKDVSIRPKVKPKEPDISIREIPVIPDSEKPVVSQTRLPSAAEVVPPFDAGEILSRAQKLASRSNLGGVISTFLQLTNRKDELVELRVRLGKEAVELRNLAVQLTDRPESVTLGEYYQTGDVLLSFGEFVLDPSKPKPFVDGIRGWMTTVQPGALVLAGIQRSGRTIVIPMWFAELPADLLSKELLAGAVVETALPLPKDTVDEIRRRLGALHLYYRKMLSAEDAARTERLLQAGKGTPEDLDFLRTRVLALCTRGESEIGSFETKISALESAVAAITAVDTVFFKDGRKLQGQVEEETDEHLRLKGRFGAARVPKSDILRVERGDAFGADFRKRYDAAKGKPADLAALLAWTKDKNIPQHRELAAYAILKGDPGNDAAWTALGVSDRGPATGPDFDIVLLRDGTRREGIISAETAESLEIDVVVRGVKTETIGTGKATIAKADIEKIERMSDAARKRAKERAVSFGDRGRQAQEAIAQVVLGGDMIQGVSGFRASGTLFELHSTLPAAQVRETAHTLEEMFNAYRRHFSIRRNASKRIDVYFFANATEYANFQQATRGAVSLNPAYFDIRANHIAAFYGVQKEEEARVRANILASEREIEQYKKLIVSEEERITREVRGLRQQILDEAQRARKAAGEDGKALSAVDKYKADALNSLKTQERAAMDQLAKYRTRANQAIGEHEAVIRHNQAVLVNQTRAMYEIFFHEAFHAFASNFLWEEADNVGLPRWLHEGMATYFERSVVEAGDLVHGGVHPTFLTLLRNQQRDNLLLAVSTVVTAGPELFQIQHTGEIPRQEAAYAHAWGLSHYLMTRGISRDQIEIYVQEVSSGKNRVEAFEKLAGRKIGVIEAEWRVHLNSLR